MFKKTILAAASAVALLSGAAAQADEAASYAQGHADWQTYKPWFDAQTGDRAAGTKYWAANRNVPGHMSCDEAASGYKTFGDKLTFTVGCQEAKRRLDPIDARRNSDPEYRLGFADAAKGLSPQADAPVTLARASATAPEPPKLTYVVNPPKPAYVVEAAPAAKAEPPIKSQADKNVVLASSPVHAADLNQAIQETGCESHYSDEKKADLFAQKYQGREFVTTGTIETVESGHISLKVLPTTFTFDIQIEMADSKAAYDLEKGQRVTVRYTLTKAGGCILAYKGKNGVIV
jgi:hypothetical protein